MDNIVVADVMTRNVESVKPDTNLLECAKKIVKKKISGLPIVSKKKLVGFISEKDILWALVKKSKEDLSKIKAIDVSPKKIATTRPMSTIEEVVSKIKKFKFNKLPVIHERELVGIITTKDILNFHPELYPELKELSEIKEDTKKLKKIKTKEPIKKGICEKCNDEGLLRGIDGMLVCDKCRSLM